jgi:hypothetical protein
LKCWYEWVLAVFTASAYFMLRVYLMCSNKFFSGMRFANMNYVDMNNSQISLSKAWAQESSSSGVSHGCCVNKPKDGINQSFPKQA